MCYDVALELPLQSLSGKALVLASANRRDDARSNTMLEAFGVDDRVHFLILWCFIPMDLAIAKLKQDLCSVDKKREYGDRVLSVESAYFIPLVLPTFDGLGRGQYFLQLPCQLACYLS